MLKPIVQDHAVDGLLRQYPPAQGRPIGSYRHDRGWATPCDEKRLIAGIGRISEKAHSVGYKTVWLAALPLVTTAQYRHPTALGQQPFRKQYDDRRFPRSPHRHVADTHHSARQS
jgi:hypothetical protein